MQPAGWPSDSGMGVGEPGCAERADNAAELDGAVAADLRGSEAPNPAEGIGPWPTTAGKARRVPPQIN
jgi:hypothetical protein